MNRRIFSHRELDDRLDRGAPSPDSFGEFAADLARELDEQDADLEITDPLDWRRPSQDAASTRVSVHQQFRADVDTIIPMGRKDEARLARRIEFARIRVEMTREAEGMSSEELIGSLTPGAATFVGKQSVESALPPRLFRRWQELHALRTELVERNLYLALINVERYSHTTASQIDLIQEGATALYRAVDGFDWRRGLLFRTYAVHWLNQAFRSHLYNFGHTVRVPVYLQKALKHINEARSRLGDANASPDQIAEEADLNANLVSTAIWAARSSYSLDVDIDDAGEGGRLRDLLPSEGDGDPYSSEIEEVSLEQSVDNAMSRLSERERFVVQQRYGVGSQREHTLAEVAAKLGVSLERVRQIQVRAINKMRTPQLKRVSEPFLN